VASLIGTEIGKYRITERLGQGGMAEVYAGVHTHLDRKVAVKVLHSYLLEGGDFVARFKREAKAVANLRHPNIVQVYDFDIQEGLIFMVMEYIDGVNLHTKLVEMGNKGERMPIKLIGSIINDIASALDYAHSKGMLHRDIKPSNIMIDSENKAYLTDFGIAKLLSDQKFTATGTLVGTPAYMSPEQGRGDDLTEESDIYSLGVVAFEMLTGQVPYDAKTPIGIVHKQINDPVPTISELVDGVPSTAQEVIDRALAKSPEGRFSSAVELVGALRIALQALESTEPIAVPAEEPPTIVDDGLEAPTVTMKAEDMEQATIVMEAEAKKEEPAEETPAERKAKEKSAPKPKGEKKKIPLWVYIAGAVGILAVVGVILTQVIDFGGTTPTTPTSTNAVQVRATAANESTSIPSSSSDEELESDPGHPSTPVEIFFDFEHQDEELKIVLGGDQDFEIIEMDDGTHVFQSGNGIVLPSDGDNDIEDWYLTFDIDDNLLFELPEEGHVRVEVEYLDQASELDLTNHWFVLQYDAHSGGGSGDGRLKDTEIVELKDTGEFKNVVFDLNDARFANLISGHDFRFNPGDGNVTLRKVTVSYYPPGVDPDAPWGNGEELFLEGTNLYAAGDVGGAIEAFENALNTGFREAEVYVQLGQAKREFGDFYGAIEQLRTATELDPNNFGAWYSLAEANFNTGEDQNKDEAHWAMDHALSLDPENASAHWLMGMIRFEMFDNPEEAIMDLSRAIELDPGNSFFYHMRAYIHSAVGEWQECIDNANEALALGSDDSFIHYRRGICYRALDEIEPAREDFENFLAMTEGNPEIIERQEVQEWLDSK